MVKVSTVAFSVCLSAAMACAAGGSMSKADISIQSLKRDLDSSDVKTVRVLFVPYDVRTVVALNPELLRTTADVSQVRELDTRLQSSLVKAIEATRVSPLDTPPDLRWGAILYDQNGKEMHSIYLNGKLLLGTGRRGIIDGNLVKLNGALIDWFEEGFPDVMRAARSP